MTSPRKKASASNTASTSLPVPLIDKRLIIAAGSKGSSGKSTILLNLVDWLRYEVPTEPSIAVFDPDGEHRTLYRALHSTAPSGGLKPPHIFETLDWRKADERHVVIDRIVRVLCAPAPIPKKGETLILPPCISLLDGVANQTEDVLFWADDAKIFDLGAEMGFRVTFLLCVDNANDTAQAAKYLVEQVGNKADYVIVRNLKMGFNQVAFDSMPIREKVLNEYGGGEITLDGYSVDVKIACEGYKSKSGHADSPPKSLWLAAQGDYAEADRFTMGRALNRWGQLVTQFERCRNLLLPDQHHTVLSPDEAEAAAE